jgi:hypothetical protein
MAVLTREQAELRRKAMETYFTEEELDIINHAIREQLRSWKPISHLSIYGTTKNLLVTFPYRHNCRHK